MVCMGFGSCTLSIFPCPASALGLGRPFFWPVIGPNPNPSDFPNISIPYPPFGEQCDIRPPTTQG